MLRWWPTVCWICPRWRPGPFSKQIWSCLFKIQRAKGCPIAHIKIWSSPFLAQLPATAGFGGNNNTFLLLQTVFIDTRKAACRSKKKGFGHIQPTSANDQCRILIFVIQKVLKHLLLVSHHIMNMTFIFLRNKNPFPKHMCHSVIKIIVTSVSSM